MTDEVHFFQLCPIAFATNGIATAWGVSADTWLPSTDQKTSTSWWPWMKKAGHRREVGQDIPQVFFSQNRPPTHPFFFVDLCNIDCHNVEIVTQVFVRPLELCVFQEKGSHLFSMINLLLIWICLCENLTLYQCIEGQLCCQQMKVIVSLSWFWNGHCGGLGWKKLDTEGKWDKTSLRFFFFTKSASHPPIFSFQICIVLIVMMWKLLHRSLLGLWNCVFFRKNLLCFFVCFIRNWNKLTMSGGSDQLRMQGRISPRCLA